MFPNYERELIEMSRPIVEEMGHEIVQNSLENYMREMMQEVKDPEVLTGESRNPGATGKWTALMGDVISSRNKIKRLLREAFRLERPQLPGSYDLITIPKKRVGKYHLEELRRELLKLVHKVEAGGGRASSRHGRKRP